MQGNDLVSWEFQEVEDGSGKKKGRPEALLRTAFFQHRGRFGTTSLS